MKRAADWKDGFLFLGNNTALDFLNTCPVQDGKAMELLPDFDSLVRWFRAAELITAPQADNLLRRARASSKAQQAYDRLLEFRETLRKEVIRWEAGKPVDQAMVNQLNRLMLEHPMLTRLKKSAASATTELYFEPGEPGDLFAPIAHSAAKLFAIEDRTRVRMCRHCVLHFEDTSKKGTRQWCSMQLCGNRAKVAAYAERKRNEIQ